MLPSSRCAILTPALLLLACGLTSVCANARNMTANGMLSDGTSPPLSENGELVLFIVSVQSFTALFVNFIIAFIIFKHWRLRRIIPVYIVAVKLTTGGIFSSFVFITSAITFFYGRLWGNHAACDVYSFVISLYAGCSLFIVNLLAFERWYSIKYMQRLRRIRLKIVIVLLLAILFAVLNSSADVTMHPNAFLCTPDFANTFIFVLWCISSFCSFLLLFSLYGHLYWVVIPSAKRPSDSAATQASVRSARKGCIISFVYMLLWLPFIAQICFRRFDQSVWRTFWLDTASIVCLMLTEISAPIIFALSTNAIIVVPWNAALGVHRAATFVQSQNDMFDSDDKQDSDTEVSRGEHEQPRRSFFLASIQNARARQVPATSAGARSLAVGVDESAFDFVSPKSHPPVMAGTPASSGKPSPIDSARVAPMPAVFPSLSSPTFPIAPLSSPLTLLTTLNMRLSSSVKTADSRESIGRPTESVSSSDKPLLANGGSRVSTSMSQCSEQKRESAAAIGAPIIVVDQSANAASGAIGGIGRVSDVTDTIPVPADVSRTSNIQLLDMGDVGSHTKQQPQPQRQQQQQQQEQAVYKLFESNIVGNSTPSGSSSRNGSGNNSAAIVIPAGELANRDDLPLVRASATAADSSLHANISASSAGAPQPSRLLPLSSLSPNPPRTPPRVLRPSSPPSPKPTQIPVLPKRAVNFSMLSSSGPRARSCPPSPSILHTPANISGLAVSSQILHGDTPPLPTSAPISPTNTSNIRGPSSPTNVHLSNWTRGALPRPRFFSAVTNSAMRSPPNMAAILAEEREQQRMESVWKASEDRVRAVHRQGSFSALLRMGVREQKSPGARVVRASHVLPTLHSGQKSSADSSAMIVPNAVSADEQEEDRATRRSRRTDEGPS